MTTTSIETEKLPHHEHPRRVRRPVIEAGLQHAPELGVFQGLLRLPQSSRTRPLEP